MALRLLRIARVGLVVSCFAVAFVAAPKLDMIGLLLAVVCGLLSVACHLAIRLLT